MGYPSKPKVLGILGMPGKALQDKRCVALQFPPPLLLPQITLKLTEQGIQWKRVKRNPGYMTRLVTI